MVCDIIVSDEPQCACDSGVSYAERIKLPSGRMAVGNLMSGVQEMRDLYACPDGQYHLIGRSIGTDMNGKPYDRSFLIKSCHDLDSMIKEAESSLDNAIMRPLTREESTRGEMFRAFLRERFRDESL